MKIYPMFSGKGTRIGPPPKHDSDQDIAHEVDEMKMLHKWNALGAQMDDASAGAVQTSQDIAGRAQVHYMTRYYYSGGVKYMTMIGSYDMSVYGEEYYV